jgi:hypothetical protein
MSQSEYLHSNSGSLGRLSVMAIFQQLDPGHSGGLSTNYFFLRCSSLLESEIRAGSPTFTSQDISDLFGLRVTS